MTFQIVYGCFKRAMNRINKVNGVIFFCFVNIVFKDWEWTFISSISAINAGCTP